jgi:hypothetical protein
MEFRIVRFPESREVRVDQKLLRALRNERTLGAGLAGQSGNCS